MRSLKFPVRFIPFFLIILFFFAACKRSTRVLKSPPHYNFSQPFTDKLDLKIREISGIAYDATNNVFLAVNDEKGVLFALDKETKIISAEYPFGDKGDYEDVTIYKGTTYILRSDGNIFRFVKDSTGRTYAVDAGKISLSGSNDFESMYADTVHKALVVICKNCISDDKKSVSAFAYYPDSIGFDSKPLYTIDAAKVAELSPSQSAKFQPSGAAIHPIMQKLFILSSASNQLVITDLDGKVESVYRLSEKLFPQPEGITFKQNGDMYISNESITSKPTLLKFVYSGTPATGKTDSVTSSYDFTRPDDKMELGKHLHEISGMSYIAGENIILAENDEKGDIFKLDYANKKDNVGKVKFGGKGDYEDIVHTNDAVYMLISSGTVVKVDAADSSMATEEYKLGIEGNNEFETMYKDADGKSLILLCKECAHEKKDQVRSAYRFDPATKTFSDGPVYSIDINAIRTMLKDDSPDFEFKPSAAGINPVNGKLYIVASVGKLLVVADKDGKVEEVYRLDPAIYNQPEGMTFAPNGDLYISNEGGEGIATILKFNYKK